MGILKEDLPFPDGLELSYCKEHKIREGIELLIESEIEVTLIRHGQSYSNRLQVLNSPDEDLTELGVAQAYAIGNQFRQQRHIGFDKIFCSPLPRAYQTAAIVAGAMSSSEPKEITLLKHLEERHFEEISGEPYARIPELARNIGRDNLLSFGASNHILAGYGIETFPELMLRAGAVLAHLGRNIEKIKGEKGKVLIVSHADITKMLLAILLGIDDFKEAMIRLSVPNAGGYIFQGEKATPLLNPIRES